MMHYTVERYSGKELKKYTELTLEKLALLAVNVASAEQQTNAELLDKPAL
jgi:hypothetical protein